MISKTLSAVAASLIALVTVPAHSAVKHPAPTAAASADARELHDTRFADVVHHVVRVNGVRFHYVTAGSGEPVLLLPGWPESWISWRKMIPLLTAAERQVIVLEPRGLGESDKPQTGYDLDTAARDLHDFLVATGLNRPGGVDIVAHDVGTWIAHAHAVAYPGDVKRLVLTEAPILGVSATPPGVPSEALNLKLWQFDFNRLHDLPETLVQGHERAYLSWIFQTKSTRDDAIELAAVDEYVRVFSVPGAARAGFEWYRAAFSPEGLAQQQARAKLRLTMPVLALGGSDGLADRLKTSVATIGDHVEGGALAGCGHFLPEECPVQFTDAVLTFWHHNR